MIDSQTLLQASQRLHSYLQHKHFQADGSLPGPDPGIRMNARIGRFIKSYTPFLPWRDDVTYMQAHGYWIFNNWLLHDILADDRYAEMATRCTDYVLSRQTPGGYWDYPNREWQGRIATVEGCFATLGLLDSYSRTGKQAYADAAVRFYDYLIDPAGIGFRRQSQSNQLAINYFAHQTGDGGGVPNNATLMLWVLARLAQATGDETFLKYARPLVNWLAHVQLDSGELPYALGDTAATDRIHFLCFQYNAFEFMDLVHYRQLTDDEETLPVMQRLAQYLATGMSPRSACRYDCLQQLPEVTYYTGALAQALSQATRLGLVDGRQLAEDGYSRVLSQQTADGGFQTYSRNNYGYLRDRRSYPRYLSMILHHLLREFLAVTDANEPLNEATA